MSSANPLWGAPRIVGELGKIGIGLHKSTVAGYMVRHASFRSPWQSPLVERLIGSIRRERLDHMIAVNERPRSRRFLIPLDLDGEGAERLTGPVEIEGRQVRGAQYRAQLRLDLPAPRR